MKWLFLILLVSCGQNKMPKKVDLNDNDGDQIPNHLEINENKYIADFIPVGDITGEMSFSVGNAIKQELFLKLSNKRDILNESLDILTRSESKVVPEEFFSEWSRIKIEVPTLPELADRIFDINLTFLSKGSEPDYVILVKSKENLKLGDFKPTMQIKLPMSDLVLLLKNEAHLAFGKRTMLQHYADSQPVQQTIREKTYRVFLNDGQEASILYVSKDYSFNKLLEAKNITTAIDITQIDPFQYDHSQPQWFYRHLPKGDRVLVQADRESLKSSYFKNFEKTNFLLKRENGKATNSLKIKKNPKSIVHLKIYPSQTMRNFREYKENVRHTIGGGKEGSPSQWNCANFYRVIASEFPVKTSWDDILYNLRLSLGGLDTNLAGVDHTVTVKEDENGQYLLVTLPLLPESLEVYLQTNPNNTFVSTGRYDLKCDKGEEVRGKISVVPTNLEGHLNLAIEAYVEKLD